MKWMGFKIKKTLRGKKLDGETCFTTRTIRIHRDLKGRTELETLLHEADHGLHPQKKEAAVLVDSAQLADLLWDYGYRLVPEKKK